MNHLDQDCDGHLHYEELANELLGLPRPTEVMHSRHMVLSVSERAFR